MTGQRIARMESLLAENFLPDFLEIIDDSHHHAGHAGAKNGAGHYTVKICSGAFISKTLIQRHRMIYTVLDSMMNSEIHALSIEAKVPNNKEG